MSALGKYGPVLRRSFLHDLVSCQPEGARPRLRCHLWSGALRCVLTCRASSRQPDRSTPGPFLPLLNSVRMVSTTRFKSSAEPLFCKFAALIWSGHSRPSPSSWEDLGNIRFGKIPVYPRVYYGYLTIPVSWCQKTRKRNECIGELHIERLRPSVRPRHAAMRHDRDRGDERQDRGRSGRGELGPPRSVSPHARRRRHDDRDAGDDRTESKYRSDRSRRHREHSSRHSSRRSRSRSGKYRDLSPSRRYSDDRGGHRPDLSPRRSPRLRGYADDGAFDDTGLGSKRLRSRSPSPSDSYRKKSRRDHSDRHSDRKRTAHRSRERYRSPRHRPRPGDRVRRDSDVSDRYDRAGSETRSVGDSRAPDFLSRNPRDTAELDTWSRDSRAGSRRSSPTRDLSPRSTYPPHNRRAASRSPARRGLQEQRLRSPDSGRHHQSPEGLQRSGRRRSRERGFSRIDAAATGANSLDVNMGSRTAGHFQGGHPSQHSSFSHKAHYGADYRTNYSQSPTPNSSYHSSPISQSQSSYLGGLTGRNGQPQFSPSQQ